MCFLEEEIVAAKNVSERLKDVETEKKSLEDEHMRILCDQESEKHELQEKVSFDNIKILYNLKSFFNLHYMIIINTVVHN